MLKSVELCKWQVENLNAVYAIEANNLNYTSNTVLYDLGK